MWSNKLKEMEKSQSFSIREDVDTTVVPEPQTSASNEIPSKSTDICTFVC